MTHGPPYLGIDIGGVLVDRAFHDDDCSFFGNRPRATCGCGVVHSPRLVGDVFDYRIGAGQQGRPSYRVHNPPVARALRFPRHHRRRHQVHFVDKRADKAPLCELLGVTHFVDDRSDVLESLDSVPNRYLFAGGSGHFSPDQPGDGVTLVSEWHELATILRASVNDEHLSDPSHGA